VAPEDEPPATSKCGVESGRCALEYLTRSLDDCVPDEGVQAKIKESMVRQAKEAERESIGWTCSGKSGYSGQGAQ